MITLRMTYMLTRIHVGNTWCGVCDIDIGKFVHMYTHTPQNVQVPWRDKVAIIISQPQRRLGLLTVVALWLYMDHRANGI